jgi:glycyl-tRNA synthetase alpha subunit
MILLCGSLRVLYVLRVKKLTAEVAEFYAESRKEEDTCA